MSASSAVAELSFAETVGASALGALATAFFTALFVTGGAHWVVGRADARRQAQAVEAERAYAKTARSAAEEHERRQQQHALEFQARAALRDSYGRLLVAQRRARQAALALSTADSTTRTVAEQAALKAHDGFIDEYHRLALDADKAMWDNLRDLRKALDSLLLWAREGDPETCRRRLTGARAARQNLERSFREKLGYQALQDHKEVGSLDNPPGMHLP